MAPVREARGVGALSSELVTSRPVFWLAEQVERVTLRSL